MIRRLLPVMISLALTACFSPVPEVECLTNVDCGDRGVCVFSKCTAGSSGGGGGSSAGGGGGGAATGGGSATGSGTGGGVTGGGAGGGSVTGGGTGGGFAGGVGGGPGGGAGGGSGVDGGFCGCRDPRGGCQPGNSPIACGVTGGQCVTCGFGEQCVNGGCVMGACGPQSCAGCCTNNFCVVPGQQSRFACGLQGAACTQCPMGQGCQNGTCATPVCDAVTCPTGCCTNGQCQPGQSRFACGVAGQLCMRCPQGQNCNFGVCLPGGFDGGIPGTDGGVFDGGTLVPAGSPCTTTQQCQPPFNNTFCLQDNIAGQPTGYTGGYCSAQCGMGMACTGGAVCITETFFGASQSICRAPCNQVGQQSTCRAGYVCAPSSLSSVPGFCRPRCDNMGALSACAAGQTCNASGVCQ